MVPFFKRSKHVKIVPNQDFLEGSTRYKKGTVYRVEMGLARYFERNGWLEGSIAAPPPAVSLDIDDANLNLRSE